jgi:nuclear pore complex protein Nup155
MVQRNLIALRSFLEGNPYLFHSTTGDYAGARAAPASDQEAWKVDSISFFPSGFPFDTLASFQAEQKSVAELQALLARTIEGVSFFLLLIDHRIGELIGQWVSSFAVIDTWLTNIINRTDTATQKLIGSMTFEELVTGQNGVVTSRALVNVIIDQQIGQQIAVCNIAQLGLYIPSCMY